MQKSSAAHTRQRRLFFPALQYSFLCAAQTARLILYKEKVILSTKIFVFFPSNFLKKHLFCGKKATLNVVAGTSFLSQDVVPVSRPFFDYYIRISVDFLCLFCYNKLNWFILLISTFQIKNTVGRGATVEIDCRCLEKRTGPTAPSAE